MQVHRGLAEVERVAAGPADQPDAVRLQPAAQAGQVGVERVPPSVGHAVVPHPVEQPAGVDQQGRENALLPRMPRVHRPPPGPCLERAQ
ncbi:hypothetical protein ACFU9X_42380 [Streptomyces atratus]|uniref:hypothetical protein n=1 Tax=Streptomyces atratus TaxID=1893 RepID=UPI00369ECA80